MVDSKESPIPDRTQEKSEHRCSDPIQTDIEDEQSARAFLRDRFLRVVFACYGKPASFSMHERTHVEALFRGTDIDMEKFQVSELQTPMGVVPEALIRSSDVLSFTVDFRSDST